MSDTRIVVAVDSSESSSDDLDLPERCRVLKLANSVTYERLVFLGLSCLDAGPFFSSSLNPRMDKAINYLEKLVLPQVNSTSSSTNPPLLKYVFTGRKSRGIDRPGASSPRDEASHP